ncbi:MAG: hypothetical protein R3Y38_00205 [Rikenellaceae bacterium]
MLKKIFTLSLALILSLNLFAQRQQLSVEEKNQMREKRGYSDLDNNFVPQGQWIFGTNFSYSLHENTNYIFTLVEGINSEGHNIEVSPIVGYAFRKNMVAGVRASYSRTLLTIDAASLVVSSTSIDVDDYYSLKHMYSGSLIWRYYIPLDRGKRFAIFNEAQLTFSGGQSKFARDQPVVGTYQEHFGLSMAMCPGVVAFATNDLAIEVNIGVFGVGYEKTTQVHNQVSVGSIDYSSMSFKVNLLSISLGCAFYL